MRQFTFILAIASIAFGLTACNNDKKETVKPVDEVSTTGGTETPEPKAEMPVDLKHEGFKYYGLENSASLTYEFDMDGNKREGEQKQTYDGMVGGKPQFTIERAEALTQLGTEVVEVREDGVYIVTSRGKKLEQPLLALPAKMEVGKTWDINQKMEDPNGNTVEMKANSKIEKQEKVKTPDGDYDCMVISMTGTLAMSGKTHKVSGKTWFAPGIGTVKLQVTSQPGDGSKASSYTISLSKPPKAE